MMDATSTEPPISAVEATGYLHQSYAESLAEYGEPHKLPGSGGWVLRRRIPGSDYDDSMGCYPLFSCRDWSGLRDDIEDLAGELVSLALVTDPFGDYDVPYLRQCFEDVVIPFKEHFVADLNLPPDTFIHPHHRRYARKALGEVSVERCISPSSFLDDWIAMYGTLTERHAINGLVRFSRESFAKQLSVPGMVAFRVLYDEATVGMALWYRQGDVAYYHLGAYSTRGYELRASFALFSRAIEYFAQSGLRWLNLGGGAGAGATATSGLSRFKQGWSNCTRTAYFCGRIFDRKKYAEIVEATGTPATNYFPAYRLGEFQ